MLLGVEWAREIERQIKQSDFLLVLLSEASARSEMVAKEVENAYKLQQQTGKSRLCRYGSTTPARCLIS